MTEVVLLHCYFSSERELLEAGRLMEKVAFEQGLRVWRIWVSTDDKDTYLSLYSSKANEWMLNSRMGETLNI